MVGRGRYGSSIKEGSEDLEIMQLKGILYDGGRMVGKPGDALKDFQ